MKGKVRTYHINLLKEYITREKERAEEKRPIMELAGAAVMEYEEGDDESVSDEEQLLDTRRTRIRETYQDVKISDKLSAEQGKDVERLVFRYRDVFTDLTKKKRPNAVKWGEMQEKAFTTLKRLLVAEPVLRLPDMSKPFVLRMDASDVGIRAVLLQQHEGKLFPVAYTSKKLLPRERKYSILEKECLAVVWQ